MIYRVGICARRFYDGERRGVVKPGLQADVDSIVYFGKFDL